METINRIVKKLKNSLDYYNETGDIFDLISDIKDLINILTIGCLE